MLGGGARARRRVAAGGRVGAEALHRSLALLALNMKTCLPLAAKASTSFLLKIFLALPPAAAAAGLPLAMPAACWMRRWGG